MEFQKARELVSCHRSYLMGFAIIWIIIHHIQFFGLYGFGYFSFFARIGSCGVDIFLFVSAFGLYHSLCRNRDVLAFYKRRLLRVLPSFIIIGLVVALMSAPLSLFSPRYWYNHFYCNWYISFILIMYLIYPFIYRIQKENIFLPLLLGIIFSSLMTIVLINLHKDDIHDVPMLMFQRFPIFMLGSLFADKRLRGKVFMCYIIPLCIMSCVLLHLSYQNQLLFFIYILFFFLAASLTLIFSRYWIKWLDKLFSFSGKISLELYLVHMTLLPYLMRHYVPDSVGICITIIVLILASYIAALILNQIVSMVESRIHKYIIK